MLPCLVVQVVVLHQLQPQLPMVEIHQLLVVLVDHLPGLRETLVEHILDDLTLLVEEAALVVLVMDLVIVENKVKVVKVFR